jgi:hypothetical protein
MQDLNLTDTHWQESAPDSGRWRRVISNGQLTAHITIINAGRPDSWSLAVMMPESRAIAHDMHQGTLAQVCQHALVIAYSMIHNHTRAALQMHDKLRTMQPDYTPDQEEAADVDSEQA